MKNFMKNLQEHINYAKFDVSTLAKKADIDRTNLNRILNGKIKEMKLESFLLIAPDLYPNWTDCRREIRHFIMVCESDLNIKKALSYCQTVGEYQLMKKLIKKHINSEKKGKINKYLQLYDLYNQRNLCKLEGEELQGELNELSYSKNEDYQIAVDMLHGFALYDSSNFMAMVPYSKKIDQNLPFVENSFIRKHLDLQHEDRKSHINLFSNNIKECRETCNNLIKDAPENSVIKAKALSCLAESFIFENPMQAETYFLESLKLIKKLGINAYSKLYCAVHSTLAFLRIEYGMNLDEIEWEFVGEAEKAFYDAKYGTGMKARSYFDNLKKQGKTLTAFKLYYLFYVDGNDIMVLKEALEKFANNGNVFYSNLITRVLIKEGVK
ncbi:AimR family lysis-lysogeny pheromone receptor [Bacillus thuringiensis]|uniref:AimR family lysis-lysogeny pheromone receptor n=1 Tax=Bacillus thuringiensis TaxID=1428 RepID=UPI002224CFA5|nr:AimR family lysis-lysogeny pheromone receptor [Bacillus thuringiensis]UYX50747.1 AimR family lysis-lysogeny pheromone receptor [Bacillus thuringiensis]